MWKRGNDMDCLPLNKHSDIEKMLANLENVRVMICFDNYSIIGQTCYQAEQRFLDMLNKAAKPSRANISGTAAPKSALKTNNLLKPVVAQP